MSFALTVSYFYRLLIMNSCPKSWESYFYCVNCLSCRCLHKTIRVNLKAKVWDSIACFCRRLGPCCQFGIRLASVTSFTQGCSLIPPPSNSLSPKSSYNFVNTSTHLSFQVSVISYFQNISPIVSCYLCPFLCLLSYIIIICNTLVNPTHPISISPYLTLSLSINSKL